MLNAEETVPEMDAGHGCGRGTAESCFWWSGNDTRILHPCQIGLGQASIQG
jgi:hypothetical protein